MSDKYTFSMTPDATVKQLNRSAEGMSDSTFRRMSAQTLRELESALAARDAEIARLRALLVEAEELTEAAIDPRYGSKDDWDWREDVLQRIKAETKTPPTD